MAYRRDRDLEFLKEVAREDLEQLKEIITQGKHFKNYNQTLSKKDPYDPLYWTYVAEQIQLYGGNTVFNLFRLGSGVLYREILCDVCDKLKVKYNKKLDTIDIIENNLITKYYADTWKSISDIEKKKLLFASSIAYHPSMLGAAGIAAVSSVLSSASAVSVSLFDLSISSMVLPAVRIGMPFVFGGFLRLAPAGWALLPFFMSGPAYRITIPACLTVAKLRKKRNLTIEENIKLREKEKRDREIIIILKELLKEQEKVICIYVFLHKILERKNALEGYEDVVKSLIFGETSIYKNNKDKVDNMIEKETFSSIINKLKEISIDKEHISSLMRLIISRIDSTNDDPVSQSLINEFEAAFC